MRDREHVLRRRRSREELKRWYRVRMYIMAALIIALAALAGVLAVGAEEDGQPECGSVAITEAPSPKGTPGPTWYKEERSTNHE